MLGHQKKLTSILLKEGAATVRLLTKLFYDFRVKVKAM